jgi:hypothetical protein
VSGDHDWKECPHCEGEAFVGHDCGEDSCCCADPEPNVRCPVCMGMGELPDYGDDDEAEDAAYPSRASPWGADEGEAP